MNPQLNVTVIISSVREGRLGPAIGNWFVTQMASRADMRADVIDLADYELPGSLSPSHPAVRSLQPHLADANAFVIVVPEYNRSIPGHLKTAIDCFNVEWQAKPFGFVSYGLSLAGGARAVEHLRLIFSEFHAVGMKDVVTFPRVLDCFAADGAFSPSDGSSSATKLMLDELAWWAHALRAAKLIHPYGS